MSWPRVRFPMLKSEWIKRYGGQEALDRDGLRVVECKHCDDRICHGWRVVPASNKEANGNPKEGEDK